MREELIWVLAWAAGGGLGTMFFGGLWWTVSTALQRERPEIWLFGGLLVRMSLALTGFYFVGGGHWERLVACVVGFVMARAVVTRFTRPPQLAEHPPRGASHAP